MVWHLIIQLLISVPNSNTFQISHKQRWKLAAPAEAAAVCLLLSNSIDSFEPFWTNIANWYNFHTGARFTVFPRKTAC